MPKAVKRKPLFQPEHTRTINVVGGRGDRVDNLRAQPSWAVQFDSSAQTLNDLKSAIKKHCGKFRNHKVAKLESVSPTGEVLKTLTSKSQLFDGITVRPVYDFAFFHYGSYGGEF